jgi:HSP20 family molecular chaperone IbpA
VKRVQKKYERLSGIKAVWGLWLWLRDKNLQVGTRLRWSDGKSDGSTIGLRQTQKDTSDEVLLEFDMPGVSRDNVNITGERWVLTVAGKGGGR